MTQAVRSADLTRCTRNTAIGPGVKSRTAEPTASTGLDSARSAIAAAMRHEIDTVGVRRGHHGNIPL